MTDVFISYARPDRALIAELAAALEARGYTVWWDWNLIAGRDYREAIEEQLEIARRVIVVWTPFSVKSKFVRDEATQGAELGKLVPVALRATIPPLGFRSVHTIILTRVPDTIDEIVAGLEARPPAPPSRRSQGAAGPWRPWFVAILLAFAIAAGVFLVTADRVKDNDRPGGGGTGPLQEVSLFKDGDSVYYLMTEGPRRSLYYFRTDDRARWAGARRGALFFDGRFRTNPNRYEGTILSRRENCQPVAFAAGGPVFEGFLKINLEGREPVRDETCEITGGRIFSRVLTFEGKREIRIGQ
ncbi:MAG: toll/interleukin-1 receptor domain-containing protein [Alphaproteobacteria bacterium]